jgi:hypothetical protein
MVILLMVHAVALAVVAVAAVVMFTRLITAVLQILVTL